MKISNTLHSSDDPNAPSLSQHLLGLHFVGLGIPLILLCTPTLSDLMNMWSTQYGFSYGFLVPLTSLYLAWLQWPTLQRLPMIPSLGSGSLWLVIATLLLLASQISGVITASSMALILVLAGLVLLLYGVAYLKALTFPLAYLIFMTPVLGSLTEPLAWPLQVLTASMSVIMLHVIGIPVQVENSIDIILPTVTLRVAQECSGAGLLTAVLAIGIPLTYLTLQAWLSRTTLIVTSVIIAIVANWFRVTIIGIYAQIDGKELHGPYHILQGLFVDWIALAFLLGGAWALGRLEKAPPLQPLPREQAATSGPTFHYAAWSRAWWLASITLIAATVWLYTFDHGTTKLKKDLTTFPAVLGNWNIADTAEDPTLIDLQNVDEYLVRTYQAQDGRRVRLSIAYMTAQHQGKELVGYGTRYLHDGAIAKNLLIGPELLSVNRTYIDKDHQHIPVLFWYHLNGVSYTDPYQAKLATIKQAFLHGRTDGALVLVSAEPHIVQSDRPWQSQEQFAAAAFPIMQEYLH